MALSRGCFQCKQHNAPRCPVVRLRPVPPAPLSPPSPSLTTSLFHIRRDTLYTHSRGCYRTLLHLQSLQQRLVPFAVHNKHRPVTSWLVARHLATAAAPTRFTNTTSPSRSNHRLSTTTSTPFFHPHHGVPRSAKSDLAVQQVAPTRQQRRCRPEGSPQLEHQGLVTAPDPQTLRLQCR
jgi:hypothetical protein